MPSESNANPLFSPAVIITLITAIVGPATLWTLEQQNQKRELQTALLTKTLELASQNTNEAIYSDKLAVILAIVEKNNFGLELPDVEEIQQKMDLSNKEKLKNEISKLALEKDAKNTEIALQNIQLNELQKSFDGAKKDSKLYLGNRDKILDKIKVLEKEKETIQVHANEKTLEIENLKTQSHQQDESTKILMEKNSALTNQYNEATKIISTKDEEIKNLKIEIDKIKNPIITENSSEKTQQSSQPSQ